MERDPEFDSLKTDKSSLLNEAEISESKVPKKQVESDFRLFEKGPSAAKRFNDLIAKTLKLQE